MSHPDALYSSGHFIRYTMAGAVDADLLSDSQVTNGIAGGTIDKALSKNVCRAIRAKAAVQLTVINERGATVTLDFATGETQIVRCSKILGPSSGGSSTTAGADVQVYW